MRSSKPRVPQHPRHWMVTVDRAPGSGRVPRLAIRRTLELVGSKEKLKGAVRVIITSDPHMRRLNRQFRKLDRPTDVLAFPLDNPFPTPGEFPLVGEVYCNYDHARRWCRQNGGTITAELSRLAVHGCLHLAGYDHHGPSSRRAMTVAENRYLKAAGLLESRS